MGLDGLSKGHAALSECAPRALEVARLSRAAQ